MDETNSEGMVNPIDGYLIGYPLITREGDYELRAALIKTNKENILLEVGFSGLPTGYSFCVEKKNTDKGFIIKERFLSKPNESRLSTIIGKDKYRGIEDAIKSCLYYLKEEFNNLEMKYALSLGEVYEKWCDKFEGIKDEKETLINQQNDKGVEVITDINQLEAVRLYRQRKSHKRDN